MTDWKIFQGNQSTAEEKLKQLLSVEAPSWRQFVDEEQKASWKTKEKKQDTQYWKQLRAQAKKKTRDVQRGDKFRLRIQSVPNPETDKLPKNPYEEVIEAVNAALYLRRPLMITGRPGSGKTSLAYALAHELNLGPVLLWPITTRSSLKNGLYSYDAIARLQDGQLYEQLMKLGDSNAAQQEEKQKEAAANFKDIGQYIRLGPVGTAFLPSDTPRVLLIDEIDKSDINLPNELLNLFEEGEFEIPELKRLSKAGTEIQTVESDDDLEVSIPKGKVRCRAFPIIIMTSNGERDFPPAFYRRCLRVGMPNPSEEALKAIVEAHLGADNVKKFEHVIHAFSAEQDVEETLAGLPTDQLLNLIYLFAKQPKAASQDLSKSTLKKLLFNPLDSTSDDNA